MSYISRVIVFSLPSNDRQVFVFSRYGLYGDEVVHGLKRSSAQAQGRSYRSCLALDHHPSFRLLREPPSDQATPVRPLTLFSRW